MVLQTLVIFDLETTGIPASDAKITEICLIAVSRNDIERADGKNLPPMDKLIFLCNPEKKIQTKAAEITGLTNHFLENKSVFKNNIECINAFLNNQPKPACLIAHNGNAFDFKILRSEYLHANKSLPADLLCVDSLKVFRSILKGPVKITADTMKNDSGISLDESDTATEEVNWLELSMEEIQEMNELLDQFSNSPTTSNDKNINTKTKKSVQSNIKGLKQEKTTKLVKDSKQDISLKQEGASKVSSSVQNTFSNISHDESTCIETSVKETRELDQFSDQFSNLSVTSDNKDTKRKSITNVSKQEKVPKQENARTQSKLPEKEKADKPSYTLESIYKRLVNKKVLNAHRAEADCIMLLECIVAKRMEFLKFADNNQKLLICINP